MSFLCTSGTATTVTSSLVPLHVASNAKGLPTSSVGAFEGLLSGMRMAMNP